LKLWKEAGIQIPPARDKEVRISLENTSFSTVVSALRFCRQELSLGLSSYDNVGAALPIDPNPESEKYHALTTMVAMIASEVFPYGSHFRSLGEWLEDVMSPRWRGMRDELANLHFHNFNANTDY